MTLNIRNIKNSDLKLLFNWVNDPDVINNSINTINKIKWLEHKKWFDIVIKNKNIKIFIFQNKKGDYVGQVRIEKIHKIGKISFSVDKKHRRKGYGKIMVDKSMTNFDLKITNFTAEVKKENKPSIKIFKSIGFKYKIYNNLYFFRLKYRN